MRVQTDAQVHSPKVVTATYSRHEETIIIPLRCCKFVRLSTEVAQNFEIIHELDNSRGGNH